MPVTTSSVEGLKKGEGLIAALAERDRFKINRLPLFGDGMGTFKIWDPTLNNRKGDDRDAQFYVSMPKDVVSLLPGSIILPGLFLETLGREDTLGTVAQGLVGGYMGSIDRPLFYFSTEKHDFSLRVFHGSGNEHAKEISKLAKQALEDPNGFTPELRAKYQKEVFEVTREMLKMESNHTFRIVEDCLASGDSIAGILTTLARMTKLGESGQLNSVRIDVAVATTQGILLLEEFSKQNGIKLDINVGYLAYGLSSGVPVYDEKFDGVVREHANYIVYPEELRGTLGVAGLEYVVGDMGDAFKSMNESFDKEYPWNKLRSDDEHGDRAQETLFQNKKFDPSKRTILFLANGGWVMRALLRHVLTEKGEDPDLSKRYNEFVFRASRTWSSNPQYGYGVAIREIPANLLEDED